MRKISSVTLDSMIFLYLFEEDKRFIKKIKPLFENIENGRLKALTSIISPLEVLSAPKLEKVPEKRTAFRRFFQKTPNLVVQALSWEVMEKAAEMRRRHFSLRTPDSIQLATAVVTKSQLFITNDEKLKKLRIMNLTISLVNELNIQKYSKISRSSS